MSDAGPTLARSPSRRSSASRFVAGEPDPESQAMWVEVTRRRGGEYTYNMTLKPRRRPRRRRLACTSRRPGRRRPARDSVERLRGATLDALRGGLKLVNPNRPEPASPAIGAGADADLSGAAGPARARGGRAADQPGDRLPRRPRGARRGRGAVAYVRLRGGCQGCGMARSRCTRASRSRSATTCPRSSRSSTSRTTQSGANPYFEAAKK